MCILLAEQNCQGSHLLVTMKALINQTLMSTEKKNHFRLKGD